MGRLALKLSAAQAVAAYPPAAGPTPAASKRSGKTTSRSVAVDSRPMGWKSAPPSAELLMSDIRYAMNFAAMNESFNRRLDVASRWAIGIGVALTSTGAVAAFSHVKELSAFGAWWTFVWAVISGVASVTRRECKFAEREALFQKAKKSLHDLYAVGWEKTPQELSKELHSIIGSAPAGGKWLSEPAYNRTCEQLNFKGQALRLSLVQRWFASSL